jgi:hypothetical protein
MNAMLERETDPDEELMDVPQMVAEYGWYVNDCHSRAIYDSRTGCADYLYASFRLTEHYFEVDRAVFLCTWNAEGKCAQAVVGLTPAAALNNAADAIAWQRDMAAA